MFTITILNDPGVISGIRERIRNEIARHQFDLESEFGIVIALAEALDNAFRHGNGGDRRRRITVQYDIDPSRVFIQVRDEGRGFRPEHIPDPLTSDRVGDCSGRGVFLMNYYVDSVRYNDIGNCVELIKHRAVARAACA